MDSYNQSSALKTIFVITIFSILFFVGISSATTFSIPENYDNIQWAIDNASNGDTIEVHSGTYFELLDVNKPLTLRGINTGTGIPVVDANMLGSPFTLSSGNSTIEGFKVINAGIGYYDAGIKAFSNNNTIKDNVVLGYGGLGGGFGILLYQSSNNTISGNIANSSVIGIYLWGPSNNNTLNSNVATGNNEGIRVYLSSNNTFRDNSINSNNYDGISLMGNSSDNTLIGNNFDSNGAGGLNLQDHSGRNTVIGNTVNSNYWGIILMSDGNVLEGNIVNNSSPYGRGLEVYSNSNNIFNNIFNNPNNFYMYPGINTWNTTKTPGINIISGNYMGGNFWAQPDGNGYSQNCIDSEPDGICDLPYELDSNNIDYLPLTGLKPKIVVYTDKPGYITGDKMYVGLNITNPGSAQKAGMYIWVDMPDGGKKMFVSYPSITLPAGLDYKKYPWKSLTLPNIPAGNYAWHAVLKNTTSGNIMSESISPWTFSKITLAAGNAEIGTMLPEVSGDIYFGKNN